MICAAPYGPAAMSHDRPCLQTPGPPVPIPLLRTAASVLPEALGFAVLTISYSSLVQSPCPNRRHGPFLLLEVGEPRMRPGHSRMHPGAVSAGVDRPLSTREPSTRNARSAHVCHMVSTPLTHADSICASLSGPLPTATMAVSPSALAWPCQALPLSNSHQQDRNIAARAAKTDPLQRAGDPCPLRPPGKRHSPTSRQATDADACPTTRRTSGRNTLPARPVRGRP
jgi:hypothetical protein